MDNILLKLVATAYNLTVSDLLSRCKKGQRPEARRMFCYLMNMPDRKPKEVAQAINRDRTNFYANIKKITFEIATYKEVQQKLKTISMSFINYLERTKHEQQCWLANNPSYDGEERAKRIERIENINETIEYINNLKID